MKIVKLNKINNVTNSIPRYKKVVGWHSTSVYALQSLVEKGYLNGYDHKHNVDLEQFIDDYDYFYFSPVNTKFKDYFFSEIIDPLNVERQLLFAKSKSIIHYLSDVLDLFTKDNKAYKSIDVYELSGLMLDTYPEKVIETEVNYFIKRVQSRKNHSEISIRKAIKDSLNYSGVHIGFSENIKRFDLLPTMEDEEESCDRIRIKTARIPLDCIETIITDSEYDLEKFKEIKNKIKN